MALKVIELFSGIGAQTQALTNRNIDHEVVGVCEIDTYAHKSYEAIHGPTKNFGDITKVEKLPDADLWTWSFPCTDLSLAGKQAGLDKGTRSGLVWEVLRLLESSNRPKYLLMENVKNLVGKKFIDDFNEICKVLEGFGYTNYWKVLNAKNFGVPQNRERVFMVSILGDHVPYKFPEGFPLEKRLKDVLETGVDDKYYLSDKMVAWLTKHANKRGVDVKVIKDGMHPNTGDYCATLTCAGLVKGNLTADYVQDDPKIIKVGNVFPSGHSAGNVMDSDGISSTITTGNHGTGFMVIEKESDPSIQVCGKIVRDGYADSCNRIYDTDGISPCIDTMQGGDRQPKIVEVDDDTIIPCALTERRTDDAKERRRQGLKEIRRQKKVVPRNDDVSNCITATQGIEQTIIVKDDIISYSVPNSQGKIHQQDMYQDEEGICRTIPAGTHGSTPHLLKTIVREPIVNDTAKTICLNSKGGSPAITTGFHPYVEQKYKEFIDEKGYIPEMFNPYNSQEITDVAPTQTTVCGSTTSSATCLIVDDIYNNREPRIYDDVAPTLRSERHGLKVVTATKQGYEFAEEGDGLSLEFPHSTTRRGRVQKDMSPTLQCNDAKGVVTHNLRIRKLTPKECWRLMGFSDEAYEKAAQVNSSTQLYKQAGNSIVVDVIEHIFDKMFISVDKDESWTKWAKF